MKRWILAWAIAFPLGLGVLFGVGCAVHANFCGGNPSAGVTDGARLYEINCVRCHGADLRGGTSGPINGPSLIEGEAAGLTAAQLHDKIRRGKPFKGMPGFGISFPHLSSAQIDALVAFLISRRGTS